MQPMVRNMIFMDNDANITHISLNLGFGKDLELPLSVYNVRFAFADSDQFLVLFPLTLPLESGLLLM